MQKIIAAFDGLKFSKSTNDYAVWLAKQTNTHLVGVFMDDLSYTSYKISDLISMEGISKEKLKNLEEKDKSIRAAATETFEKACQASGLEHTIHHDRSIALQELKHESIYTDLLIIDSKETLKRYEEPVPTRFIRELLSDVQCPVLIVPKKYKAIGKIILLYDGEPSSVHAIKMFSYILPQLKHLNTEIISVNPSNATLHLPDNKLMKEFIKRHYPDAKYTVIKGGAENEIVLYLKQTNENAIVVLGANRRGSVSRLFRESMADTLMKELKLPLFVAPNK